MEAGGSEIKSHDGEYGGRITPTVLLACIVAASGGLLFGYDLGISGGVTSMDTFLKEFFPDVYAKMKDDIKVSNYCKFNSQMLTAFTSSLYIASLVTSLFTSRITDTFGRRLSMIIGGSVFLSGSIIGAAAVNLYMLIFGRILLGIGVGFTNQSIPLYLSEMAPPRYRGAIYNAFEIFLSIGVLFANVVNFGSQKIQAKWNWRVSLAVGAAPASFLAIGSLFLPDTPSSIIQMTGNLQKASELLKKIRGTKEVQAELDDLASACATSGATRHPFRKIVQKQYRPHLLMAIALPFLQQVTGINSINFYAPIMFRTIGFKESASLMSAVATRLTATCVTLVAMTVVDRWGRRTLLLAGGFMMLISLLFVGGILSAELKDHGAMSKEYGYVVLVVICVYVTGFVCSWGALAWLIAVEILPLEVRSAGQSIVVAVSSLSTFAVAQSFLAMLCHFKSGNFFFFGGCVLVMSLLVYMFLPETKGLPLEQMERVWRDHWYWKRVVKDEVVETKVDSIAKA